ncbi:hypothetical protein CWI42_100300 [Ordospora colligata]|uniref:Transcription elongation factor 1 homolog n=1 Tax=Ordospora colligata OC4 TaxID=1354746 RepID=A0A0B2UD97_9MICR|nr:uncharacterized protein M896_100300 [Ordospora colligata OC4]KHN69046.1 hypothetical protein M896_100300 [Ordospora colligata OC4]TBU14327.1 hypothetical protein CWI40_100310 [Ordospora colligata]TBU14392.1 hypothetical protein CWI41_100310 [Ordospora colligata]TBU17953.1 hypothetical protein CWI42_100300 [Ordospora colligata]
MGRKKVRRKVNMPRKQTKLERQFNCPMCSHENVVQCVIKKMQMKGIARCSVCEASFMCDIDKLTTGIDVYSAWVDSCSKD